MNRKYIYKMVHPLKVILNSDRNKVKILKVDRKPVERTFDVFFRISPENRKFDNVCPINSYSAYWAMIKGNPVHQYIYRHIQHTQRANFCVEGADEVISLSASFYQIKNEILQSTTKR